MNLLKTSIYTSLSTAISFISGFIVTKVVAMRIGAAGIALLGQYQNTIAIISMVATCAIINGVIKYIATHANNKNEQQKVITTAITVTVISSLIISLFVVLFSNYLSVQSFNTKELQVVYIMYGVFLTLISLNTIISGIYNGLKEIRKLTVISIISSLSGTVITVFFANVWGVKGVLIAGNFIALVTFILNVRFLKSIPFFQWRPAVKKSDQSTFKLLLAFTLMNIVSGILSPLSQLIVRNYIITNFSATEAGFWQGVSKISDYYLLFITTVLGVYYVPKLSELKERDEIKKEIIKSYIIIMPLIIILAFIVYICRPFIVQILFTDEFTPMLPLFKFQLLGDIFRISSLLFAFLMISKAMTKNFIITELVFTFSFVALSIFFVKAYGVIGVTYAFCLNYFLYSFTVYFIARKYLDKLPGSAKNNLVKDE